MKNAEKENLIKIVDGYYFTADSLQYILYECGTRNKIDRMTKKTTDETIEYQQVIGYYGSLTQMIEACISYISKSSIKDGSITSLNGLINHIDEISTEIKKSIKGK